MGWKVNHHFIAYFLRDICVRMYQNWLMYIEVIVCHISVVFWDTVYVISVTTSRNVFRAYRWTVMILMMMEITTSLAVFLQQLKNWWKPLNSQWENTENMLILYFNLFFCLHRARKCSVIFPWNFEKWWHVDIYYLFVYLFVYIFTPAYLHL